MTASRGPALRVARAAGTAGTSLAFAVGAHVVAGGDAPTGPVLVAVAAVTLAVATPLTGRRLPAVGLAPLLAALQTVVHTGLSLLTGTGTGTAAGTGAGAGAHHHGAVALSAALPDGTPPHPHDGPGMLAAHAAAVLLTAALIAGADRAAESVARCWAFVAHAVRVATEHVDVPVARPRPLDVLPRPATVWLPSAAPRRGPPALPLPGR